MEAAKPDNADPNDKPVETTALPSLPASQPPVEATLPTGATEAKPAVPPAEIGKTSSTIRPQVRPHAFVIMPFGKKKSSDGSMIYDFNAIYSQIIKPALEISRFRSLPGRRGNDQRRHPDRYVPGAAPGGPVHRRPEHR